LQALSRAIRLSKPAAIDLIEHPRRRPFEPPLKLPDWNEYAPTSAHDAQLGADVLVEEVP
jgi:hypothetical protein